MGILNKLYWTAIAVLAGSAVYIISNKMLNNYNPKDMPQKSAQASLEEIADKQKSKPAKALKVFKGYEDATYQQYDDLIKKYIKKWDSHFRQFLNDKPALNPNIAKSLLIQESGSPAHKDAWNHDPAQLANQGDYGLTVLRDRTEHGIPKELSDKFRGIRHTPRKGNKWDYSDSNMTPELSVEGMIFLLYRLRFEHAEVEKPDPDFKEFNYVVKKGDNVWDIAKAAGTTANAIINANNLQNPRQIYPGQTLKITGMNRTIEPVALKSGGWETAVARYNGNGTENYSESIFQRE